MTEWHPIRVAARRTGLTPQVIRAWEKRYGAVTPHRTETNRRLYSNEDVERLTLLRRATLLGRSIGQIATQSTESLRALVAEDEALQRSAGPESTAQVVPRKDLGGRVLNACLEAAKQLDAVTLQRELDGAFVSLSRPVLMSEVVVPLMQMLGAEWREGTMRVSQEHLATAAVRSFVGSLNGAQHVPISAPAILVTTPHGQVHEIGALLAATIAAADGWRAIYLGPNLPAEEIASAAAQREAHAVALSIVYPTDDPHLGAELGKLRRFLGPDIHIIVGGRAAPSYRHALDEIGAIQPPDLDAFVVELQALRG